MSRSFIVLSVFSLALGLGLTNAGVANNPDPARSMPELEQNTDLYLFPFGLMDSIREPQGTVPMQVQAYFSGVGQVSLRTLKVYAADGVLLEELDLRGERLIGDGGLVARAHLLMETINPEITHRHDQRIFIPLEDRPELSPDVESALFRRLLDTMSEVVALQGSQLRNLKFDIYLPALFPIGSQPGDEAVLDLVLDYELDGSLQQTTIIHPVVLLEPYLPPPAGWSADGSTRNAGAWHRGDLHVHNCRDEAVSGCPSCAAESFNISGSFSNADLKPQFQALGMDWFSTTTHSYCINSDNEFNAVAAEAASLDDSSFALLCGTELTTKESGPQTGSDIFDTICFLNGNFDGRGTAHMGGHSITSRKPGGKDGFMDNCDNPLYNHMTNIDNVNAEGGFTIANHPGGGGIWGGGLNFNSIARFEGMEAGQAVGCEVWNGTSWNGSPEHESWWTDRLLEGKFTWPFSGSDTHDSAVDFGVCHVWLDGPITDAALTAAMRGGKHYLSNGPFLVVNLFDANGHRIDVGGVAIVKKARVPNNYPLTVELPYNFGADVGDLEVFRGTVGDSAETLIHSAIGTSGAGTLQVPTTLPNRAHSWFRAEFTSSSGKKKAYTSLIIIALI